MCCERSYKNTSISLFNLVFPFSNFTDPLKPFVEINVLNLTYFHSIWPITCETAIYQYPENFFRRVNRLYKMVLCSQKEGWKAPLQYTIELYTFCIGFLMLCLDKTYFQNTPYGSSKNPKKKKKIPIFKLPLKRTVTKQ